MLSGLADLLPLAPLIPRAAVDNTCCCRGPEYNGNCNCGCNGCLREPSGHCWASAGEEYLCRWCK